MSETFGDVVNSTDVIVTDKSKCLVNTNHLSLRYKIVAFVFILKVHFLSINLVSKTVLTLIMIIISIKKDAG